MCCFLTGNGESAALYDQAVAFRLEAMESVLWDAEGGAWFDCNLVTHSRPSEFYPSNLEPLWAQCYSQPVMGEKAVQYLEVGGYSRSRRTNYFVFIKMAKMLLLLLRHKFALDCDCHHSMYLLYWCHLCELNLSIQWPRIALQLKKTHRKKHSKL